MLSVYILFSLILSLIGALEPENVILKKCCEYGGSTGGNSRLLLKCILESDDILQEKPVDGLKIGMTTYYDGNIEDYAAYSIAINAAYVSERGYNFVIHSPQTQSNFEPRDARWNRVKILSSLMVHDYDYLVWVDADLAVTDWSLSLEDLISLHPESDIIISAEHHAETGVANTGSIIVKNSAWARDFLGRWWDLFDRGLNHDQIFFDRLYKMLSKEEKKRHITILPTNTLNSVPPPMLFQREADAVLHLMGEGNGYRSEVFQLGFSRACLAHTRGEARPPQLGLTQPILLHMALSRARAHLTAAVAQLSVEETNLSRSELFSTSSYSADRLHEATERLTRELHIVSDSRETTVQINKYVAATHEDSEIDKATALAEVQRALELLWAYLQKTLDVVLAFSKQVSTGHSALEASGVESRAMLRQSEVDLLNAAATVGHDLMGNSQTSVERAEEVYASVPVYLDLLENRVLPAHTTVIAEMRAMMLRTRARLLQSGGRTEQVSAGIEGKGSPSPRPGEMAAVSLSEAVETLRVAYFGAAQVPIDAALVRASQSSTGNVPNVHHLVGCLEDLGALLCGSDEALEAESGVENLRTALMMRRTLLEAESQWKADHALQARTASQAAVCASKVRMTGDAQAWLQEAGSLLERNPDPSSADPAVRAAVKALHQARALVAGEAPPERRTAFRRKKTT